MNRIQVIQGIINRKNFTFYMEIGIFRCKTFIQVRCKKKIGVDPSYSLSLYKRIRWYLSNLTNFSNMFFKETSDVFFNKRKQLLEQRPIDIAFVDGKHTHEQSLKDVLNVLKYLRDDGVIIMHDSNPSSKAHATKAKSWEEAESLEVEGWTGSWCGDVWKTAVYLRVNRKDLNVFVLNTDSGLSIITRKSAYNYLDEDEQISLSGIEIEKLNYSDLESNRKSFLNLKEINYFQTFLDKLKV